MSPNFNIYERLDALEKEISFLKEKVDHYERGYSVDSNVKKVDDENKNDLWTINDILRQYNISRQCLHNYRKLVPLKKCNKIGRFDRFRKKDILAFMEKIMVLKGTHPQLFLYKTKKLF